MDKRDLLAQLERKLSDLANEALGASVAAAQEAQQGATSKEKRDDSRVAIEYAGLARGQKLRAERAQRELDAVASLRLSTSLGAAQIELGSVVEVENEDTGEGRTLLLAPAGAGITLTGPGGDGLLSVVTPSSPLGRGILGKRVGDVVDVTVNGEIREWTITWVA
jgi:transcription elongation GreA/GreB family factor